MQPSTTLAAKISRDGESYRHIHTPPARADHARRRRRTAGGIEHDRSRDHQTSQRKGRAWSVERRRCPGPESAANIIACIAPKPATHKRLRGVARFALTHVAERFDRAATRDSRAGECHNDLRQRERSCRRTLMRARCAPAFTPTSTTPGSRPSARSISQLQAEHRIPSMSTTVSLLPFLAAYRTT